MYSSGEIQEGVDDTVESLEDLIEANPERFERLISLAVRALDASGAGIESLSEGRVEQLVVCGEVDGSARDLGSVYRNIGAAEGVRVVELAGEEGEGAFEYGYCAGVPLRLPSGETVGIVSVVGDDLESWEEGQRALLERVGRTVSDALKLQWVSRKLRRANEELKALISASPVAIVTFDWEGIVQRWSRSAEETFGYQKEEVVGERMPMAPGDSYPEFDDFRERIFSGNRVRNWEIERPTKAGEMLVLSVSAAPVYGPDGDVQQAIALLQDVTERRRHERALERSEQRFRRIFEEAGIGIALVGVSGRIQKVNPALADMLGYSARELAGTDFSEITHPDDVEKDVELFEELAEGERDQYRIEKRYLTKSGEICWGRLTVSTITDPSGAPEYMLGMVEDITAQKEAEQELVFRAQHDALTGLINRKTFRERLRRRIEKAEQTDDYGYAVLFLDLDDLKDVNDRLGHSAGDTLLTVVAERLEELLRAGDSVARMGGDEFAVLLEHVGSREEVRIVADRIQVGLGAPTMIEREILYPSASIGIAMGDATYDGPDEILRDADSAMYAGKDLGGGRIAISDEPEEGRAEQTRALGSEVRRAIEEEALEVRFRPVVHLETREVGAAVVDPYWRHPEQGVLEAEQLRLAAGFGGAGSELEHWIIERACRQVQQWHDAPSGGSIPRLFVPCASKHSTRSSFTEALRETECTVSESGKVTVGVPEDQISGERSSDAQVLEAYRSLGIGVGIDGFGRGAMSLRLFEFAHLDWFVLAPRLLEELAVGEPGGSVVQSAFLAAEEFDKTVIAAGIETSKQREALVERGCEWGTGPEVADPIGPDPLWERYEGVEL